jgi:cytosine/adenosine deaminase-related metal-dependent hydrolase
MRRLHRSDPAISPRSIVEAATAGGARALQLRGAGTLRRGARANFVVLEHDVPRHRPDRFLRGDLEETLVNGPIVADVHCAP